MRDGVERAPAAFFLRQHYDGGDDQMRCSFCGVREAGGKGQIPTGIIKKTKNRHVP